MIDQHKFFMSGRQKEFIMALGLIVSTNAYSMNDSGASKEAEAPVLSPLEVRDWFALGSGCRGRKGEEGKVKINVRQNQLNQQIYHVDFELDSYQLDGDKAISEKPSFARECSLRIAAYPGKNLRISNLSMDADLGVRKDKGSSLTLISRILTVQGNLNEWSVIHDKGERIARKTHKIYLSPDENGRNLLGNIPCETPKILGADFQILNERESFKPKVRVGPSGKGTVSMTVTLSKCQVISEKSRPEQESGQAQDQKA